MIPKTSFTLKIKLPAWVAQVIKQPTSGFGLCHDLKVVGLGSMLCRKSALRFSLALCPSPCSLALSLSLSLSEINNLKKIKIKLPVILPAKWIYSGQQRFATPNKQTAATPQQVYRAKQGNTLLYRKGGGGVLALVNKKSIGIYWELEYGGSDWLSCHNLSLAGLLLGEEKICPSCQESKVVSLCKIFVFLLDLQMMSGGV